MEFRQALNNPSAVFDTPEQVLADPRLDRQGKLAILRSWEQDARELAVAEDENMAGGEPNMLIRVLAALGTLSVGCGEGASAPTRHGSRAVEPAARATRHSQAHETGSPDWRRVSDLMRPTEQVLYIEHTLGEALARMREQRLTLMPVADGDEVVGVVNARDILNLGKAGDDAWQRLSVAEVMSTDVVFCLASDDVFTAKDAMVRAALGQLLVLNEEAEYVGTITHRAIAKTTAMSDQAGDGSQKAPEGDSTRTIQTAGQARGQKSALPGSYSVKPKVRR